MGAPCRLPCLGLICLGLFAMSGCLPVAWVTPPIQLDVGGGASIGTVADDAAPRATIPIGVGAYPLSVPESLYHRPVDFGLGYRGVFSLEGSALHAPYLEVAYLHRPELDGFWQRAVRGQMRVGLAGRGKVYFGPTLSAPMPAMSLRFFTEFIYFHDAEGLRCDINFATSWFCGVYRSYGERGWGLYAEAQRGFSLERNYTGLFLGLYVRTPASLGAGLVGSFNL